MAFKIDVNSEFEAFIYKIYATDVFSRKFKPDELGAAVFHLTDLYWESFEVPET
ncbi:hypothetical protein K7I13_02950 [Brucepastera parasyntrophica]|uniref:hypothetical protein n=1 Tax=Brucepastera parasyntrophica TaxID=2880008 RepID=UPI00210B1906|nr:hypothetical protein [Brucepastera parasyntrophica]ULQ60286.1 hypothetical protein K7I13_02950 [Brucepastera parasyntrophica]